MDWGGGRMGGTATLAGVGGGGREGGFGGSVRRRGGDGGSNGVALVDLVCRLMLGPGRGRRDDGDGGGAAGAEEGGSRTAPTKMRGSGAVARPGHAAC